MSSVTSDRGMMMGMPAMGMGGMPMGSMMPGMGMMNPTMGAMPGMMMGQMPAMMAPRCTMKLEKCPGGMMATCTAADKTTAMMMQNLCNMMAGGMCSMGCMMNGMMTCLCNVGAMGMCKMEMIEMGCRMTCTSGDKNAEKMIKACCDCLNQMMMPGMMCCMMMNGMPVCCMIM
jgi:hypothetical protein